MSGHLEQGIGVLRDVLAASGMRLAPAPWQALLSTLFRRAFINLRGLGFRETDPGRIPPQVIIRIDTCWSVAQAWAWWTPSAPRIFRCAISCSHCAPANRIASAGRSRWRPDTTPSPADRAALVPEKSFRPTACWPRESSTSTRTPSVWPRWWKAWRHSLKDAGARRVTSTNAPKPFCASVVAASPGNSPPHG